jgi:hypothetical protein
MGTDGETCSHGGQVTDRPVGVTCQFAGTGWPRPCWMLLPHPTFPAWAVVPAIFRIDDLPPHRLEAFERAFLVGPINRE